MHLTPARIACLAALALLPACIPYDAGALTDSTGTHSSSAGPTTETTTTTTTSSSTSITGTDSSMSASESGTTTSTTAPPPNCGDGTVDPDEECDDMNQDDADSCLNNCQRAECGDSIVWTADNTEECDDGNDDDTDACVACKNAFCGDGFVQAGAETCDNGPANEDDLYDGCTTTCVPGPFCGDGIQQDNHGEKCDDGTPDGDDLCNNCTIPPIRYIFATAATYTGKFGSTTSADGLCTTTAGMNGVGAPGAEWTAWLSDNGSSAGNRYTSKTFDGWYVLPGDPPALVAKGWAGLTSGTLMNPINRDETGTALPGDATAWTTTAPTGDNNDLTNHCDKWNNNTNGRSGRLGSTSAMNSQWTDKAPPNTALCSEKHHIYCVEN